MSMNTALIKEFVALEEQKGELESQLNDVNARRTALKESILAMFTDANVQHMSIDGRTVYLSRQVWASANEEAHELLRKHGLGWMIQEKVNTQTLSAEIRDWEEEGKEIPEDLREVINIREVFDIRSRKQRD